MPPTPARPRVHAVTSRPMMTQRDPWVNMLRTTLAAFARRRRRCRHRAGAAVRRRDPRRIPRHRSQFRPPDRPQHPTAAAGGVAHRPGARPGGRLVVRRGPHRSSLAEQAWTHFQEIEARGGFVEAPRLSSPSRSPRCATAAPTTSPTGAPRSPVSTSTRTSPNRRCRRRDSESPVRALRRRLRGAARPLRRLPGRSTGPGRRCCCCRWARSPSTTSARRSRPTCWPPAASRPSTPAPSTPPASPQAVPDAGAAVAVICGTDARYGDRGRRGRATPPARPGVAHVYLAGPEKAVADAAVRSPTTT